MKTEYTTISKLFMTNATLLFRQCYGLLDLLHLDGLHTYDVVKHDFVSWVPKFSRGGVALLLHDINVHQADFGVWRLWQELPKQYPHFEFHHCFGLGVLSVGTEPPEAIAELGALTHSQEGATLRGRLALIGDRWLVDHDLRAELTRQYQSRTDTEALLNEPASARSRAEAALADAEAQTGMMQRERLEAASAEAWTKLREVSSLAG
jgi:hypothetical protein